MFEFILGAGAAWMALSFINGTKERDEKIRDLERELERMRKERREA